MYPNNFTVSKCQAFNVLLSDQGLTQAELKYQFVSVDYNLKHNYSEHFVNCLQVNDILRGIFA